jgi:hypothetical protein
MLIVFKKRYFRKIFIGKVGCYDIISYIYGSF